MRGRHMNNSPTSGISSPEMSVTVRSENSEIKDLSAINEAPSPLELSVVIPCLNEAETVSTCIRKAQQVLHEHQIDGEIVVADNGSTDGSQALAMREGARVVNVEARGYGSALIGGIYAARGRFIIMGDADDSYDFLEIPKFVRKLREGFDLVQGCRLPIGGGKIMPGAMPFWHRVFGNPVLSGMARRMFRAPIHDVYCGLRGFSKQLYERLHLRCSGMEFATEMIIKASLWGEKITEVPITLHPDGRRAHPPHLKTLRDGWRTLRLFMMFSPRWLFVIPGALLILSGIIGYAIALPRITLNGVTFDAHTLLFASLAILCGYQSVLFAIFTKTLAIAESLMPADRLMIHFFQLVNLERGLIMASVTLLLGLALLLVAVFQWQWTNFGPLDYARTMRWVIPGATLTALGFQTLLSSFFVSILGMFRK